MERDSDGMKIVKFNCFVNGQIKKNFNTTDVADILFVLFQFLSHWEDCRAINTVQLRSQPDVLIWTVISSFVALRY
jgi:hypothetical protein